MVFPIRHSLSANDIQQEYLDLRHKPYTPEYNRKDSIISSESLSPLGKLYGNFSTLNPLLTKGIMLDLDALKSRCPTLMKITQKKKFNPEKAAQEVVNCLALSQGPELLAEVITELKGELEGTKRSCRYNELMASLLLYPQAVGFIADYVVTYEDCDKFSVEVIAYYHKRKAPPLSVIYSLSLLTKRELEKQDLETLFRETTLSCSLCREYGIQLLDCEFQILGRSLKRLLERIGPINLCLNEKLIQKYLFADGELSPSFNINARVQENIPFCKAYFREVLGLIYQMKLSNEFQSLLNMYRAQIAKHFSLIDSDERLDVFTGQLFFLRILNPFIIAQGSTELERSALISLTKVTQALTNFISFGTEKQDKVFESFNDIYDGFQIIHQQFIKNNSL